MLEARQHPAGGVLVGAEPSAPLGLDVLDEPFQRHDPGAVADDVGEQAGMR